MQLIYPVITSGRRAVRGKFIDKLKKSDESLISRLPRFTFRTNLSRVSTASLDAVRNGKCM